MRSPKKATYEDQYVTLSVIESVPCIKVKLFGVPKDSDHYQLVQAKVLETIRNEISNFCRLHLLTDTSEGGLVLDEDIMYYKKNVIPRLEEAGIRY